MTIKQGAQSVRMGWMAQPDKRFSVQLAGTLAADLQMLTHLVIEARSVSIQPIACDNDVP